MRKRPTILRWWRLRRSGGWLEVSGFDLAGCERSVGWAWQQWGMLENGLLTVMPSKGNVINIIEKSERGGSY